MMKCQALMGLLPILCVVYLTFGTSMAGDLSDSDGKTFSHYIVDKKVSDFPESDDFGTPESAYAVINRVMASGGSWDDWNRITYRNLGRSGSEKQTIPPDVSKMWNNATIREVWIYEDQLYGYKVARVFAEINSSGRIGYDQRTVVLVNGRWLNCGQDGAASNLDDARVTFQRKAQRLLENVSINLAENQKPPTHPAVEDPQAYLEAFIQFLYEHGRDPEEFILDLLPKNRIVIMGEVHHRPLYWQFNSRLIENPRFADTVGVIYMELPKNDQALIDNFLNNETLDTTPVVKTLRDMFEMGWPDKPMLDFFVTVWRVNQTLPADKKLRIILVDMERPWDKIKVRRDWGAYSVDRNKFMADNILSDLDAHADDNRNALFIVGFYHAMLDIKRVDNKTPVRSAGWHLRQGLGKENVYAIFPHGPVQTNMGDVHGRICRGLFDNAFAANDNKPIAFPLTVGPFGQQWFDSSPDRRAGSASLYRDGFDAYIFLGPLENEVFSPLIPGFYTDGHMKEIDRRYRLMRGKSWHEIYGREATDAENFTEWMSGSWGQPRKWSNSLGAIDAWKFGDN